MLAALVAWMATTNGAQSTKPAKPETVLRWSFIGTEKLAEKKELEVFRTVRELPESAAWRDAAAANLAERAAKRYTKGGNTNAVAQIAEVIKPLIVDLVVSESRFQMDSAGGEEADWMLALKVDDKRHAAWGKSLMELTRHTGMQGAASDKSSWVATRDRYKISFTRAKDWTLIEGGFGAADSKASKEFRASLNKRAKVSGQGAGQVLQRFGGLLEQRKFAEARKLWSDDGKASGLSEAEFVAAYDKYAEIHSEVGAPGQTEGAAGSIYVEIPFRLYGKLRSGGAFNLVGPITLRRVNDVPGSTEEQRRWHIYRSGLKPRP